MAAISAVSSIKDPRAQLTMRTPGFIWSNCSFPNSGVPSACPGVCKLIKSDRVSKASISTNSTPSNFALSCVMKGSYPKIFIWKARALSATLEPILPNPMIPSVFSKSSTPMNSFGAHFLFFNAKLACGMFRERAIIKAIVCSAVVIILPSGAFMTMIPFLPAAAKSILSTPTPALPITLRLSAISIISATTLVALRTIKPSYSGMMAISSSLDNPVFTSTSMPDSFFRISTPEAERLSETKTFIC